jgi:DNA-binding IclR family transcriptional regulator
VIRYDAELGERRPAYCTAMGQVLLADLPAAQLEAYLRRRRLQRFTRRTITTRAGLTRKLEQIRRLGVAVNVEERVTGASAVGAAIRAGAGRAIAGIIVAGPSGRITARRDALVGEVREAAARISQALQEELSRTMRNGAADALARPSDLEPSARGAVARLRE